MSGPCGTPWSPPDGWEPEPLLFCPTNEELDLMDALFDFYLSLPEETP